MLTPLRRFGLIAHRPISVLPVGSGVPSVRSFHSSTFRRAKIVSFDQPEPQPRQPPQTYDHTQTPGSTFKPLGVDQLNRRDVNYGIGTPAAIVSGGAKKRRHMRPYGVQGIRTPMTTKVEGPRELGHSVREQQATERQGERDKGERKRLPLRIEGQTSKPTIRFLQITNATCRHAIARL